MATATRSSGATGSEAERNRRALRDAGVFAVNLIGGPGCGKSTLVRKTLERLNPRLRVAVIAGSPAEMPGPDRGPPDGRVLHIDGGPAAWLDAATVGKALGRLDLASLDLLVIEDVGTLTVPEEHRDLGQDVTVTVFSVAAGDDKARKHHGLVRSADAVVLNKTDLALVVPFDLTSFRSDVRGINGRADLFEVSALNGRGVTRWVAWLSRRLHEPTSGDDASHWFG